MRLCMHMNSDTIQNLKTHHRNKIAYCKLNLADTYSCSNYSYAICISKRKSYLVHHSTCFKGLCHLREELNVCPPTVIMSGIQQFMLISISLPSYS